MCNQAVNVVNREHDPAQAQRVYGGVYVAKSNRFGGVIFVEFNTLTIGRTQHGQGGFEIAQPDQPADLGALDDGFAFEREADRDENLAQTDSELLLFL